MKDEVPKPSQTESPQFGLFLSTRDAMAFLGAPSMTAAYSWLHRHGILRRGNGTVSRLDIARELKRRSRRGRSPNSLANLRNGGE